MSCCSATRKCNDALLLGLIQGDNISLPRTLLPYIVLILFPALNNSFCTPSALVVPLIELAHRTTFFIKGARLIVIFDPTLRPKYGKYVTSRWYTAVTLGCALCLDIIIWTSTTHVRFCIHPT